MTKKPVLKRRTFLIDEYRLRSAKKALGLSTDAEVVREAIERVAQMDEFWEFQRKTGGVLEPGSIET